MGLDWHAAAYRAVLTDAVELAVRHHETIAHAPTTTARGREEIAALFDEPLPQEPQPASTILREVEERIFANSTLYGSPRFFGYINGSGTQVGAVAELLAAVVNQIPAKYHFAPAATEVERRVVRWLAEFIGYGPDAHGCLLGGGSAGNLAGLAMARQRHAGFDAAATGMRAGPPLTAYVSREGHASLDKAMALLGMGREQLRRIAVRDDFTMDLDALAREVDADRRRGARPICVVANAGTTNTGAIDPLDALADFCREQGLWLHVDAAYGGPAAATRTAGPLFHGLARADSAVLNPHKWLYVPVEAACILVRDPDALRDTFHVTADYLREPESASDGQLDFKDYGPQLTRSFRALKVWMTFKAYGARALRDAIEGNLAVMRHLAARIDASEDFVRLAPVPLSTVCFQYRPASPGRDATEEWVDALNARLPAALERDGRVFLSATRIAGRPALRACTVNHRVREEDADALLDVIRDVARALLQRPETPTVP